MKEFTKIDKSKYEELCKEACNNFIPSGNRERDEEQLLLDVCINVYRYLKEPLDFIPTGDKLYTYKYNLQKLVLARQIEPFDTLEIPGAYIFEVLDRVYKPENK